ncbi:MAG: RebB family R body protein [Magnetospirillum sp. WYHS-4]
MADTSVSTTPATDVDPANLALAPAMAMAALYQSFAHSTSLLYENAVAAQAQGATMAQGATTAGLQQLQNLGGMAAAVAAAKIAQTGGKAPPSPAAAPQEDQAKPASS